MINGLVVFVFSGILGVGNMFINVGIVMGNVLLGVVFGMLNMFNV